MTPASRRQILALLPFCIALWYRDTIGVLTALSLLAYLFTDAIIPTMGSLLEKANMTGRDLNKPKQPVLPESLGIAAGAVYISAMFLFLPFPFLSWSKQINASKNDSFQQVPTFISYQHTNTL